MQQLLITLLLVLFILSLTNKLDELKKNPKEFIKRKFLEFFTVSIKDKQKVGTSYNDENNKPPNSTFKLGTINLEKCYSTETRSGNATKRSNSFYCNQEIDGGEVIPYDDLYTMDFSNYNIHYGKIAKGVPLSGTFSNVNNSSLSLDTKGEVINTALNVNEAKLFCDSMKDKCYGFIMIIPTKNNNLKSTTFFISKTLEGWEDPDTYIKMNSSKLSNSDNDVTNTNYISYIKKNVSYVEKPIDSVKLKTTSDKYNNHATCNWKSNNRCIFTDYTYDQPSDTCKSKDGNPAFNVVGYTKEQLADWLKTLYNRDMGPNKLTSESVNVHNYIERCKDVDGYDFLSTLNLPKPYTPTTQSGDIAGRYVRISINNKSNNWLHLAEIQVIRNNRNIAIGKPTSSSSVYAGATSGRANDGNNDGNFNNGSVSHTDNTGNPEFWEVDLGDSSDLIDRIIVSNRTDGGGERLNNWLLSIYNTNKTLVWARIFKDPPNPKTLVDISQSNNDMSNIRIKDYVQSRFNNYFYRVSDTEYTSKRGRDGTGCYDQCHKEICEGEKKKWIGNNDWYGCRDYKSGEYEAEQAQKNQGNIYALLDRDKVISFFGDKTFKLLYRASADGWNPQTFHSRCDNKGATVSIGVANNGQIIGGYSDISWGTTHGNYTNSAAAFLFDKNQKYTSEYGSWGMGAYTVYHNSGYYSTFGGGHDFYLTGQTLTNNAFTFVNSSRIGPNGVRFQSYYNIYTLVDFYVFSVSGASSLTKSSSAGTDSSTSKQFVCDGNSDDFLTSADLRAGAWMDGITLRCNSGKSQTFGGNGGGPAGSVNLGSTVQVGEYSQFISKLNGVGGAWTTGNRSISCPSGKLKGMEVGGDNFIQKLTLLCGE